VFAAFVWFKKPCTAADALLAAILVVLGLLCAKVLLHTMRLWEERGFRYLPLGIDLWLQPLLFLYVLALTKPRRLQRSLMLKHLLLPFVFLTYAVVVYGCFLVFGQGVGQFDVAIHLYYTEIKALEDLLSIVLGFWYGFGAYRQLGVYHRWVRTYTSDTAIPTHRWLLRLMLATAVVLLLLGAMLISEYLVTIQAVPILAKKGRFSVILRLFLRS
jgi:hypothetical protein